MGAPGKRSVVRAQRPGATRRRSPGQHDNCTANALFTASLLRGRMHLNLRQFPLFGMLDVLRVRLLCLNLFEAADSREARRAAPGFASRPPRHFALATQRSRGGRSGSALRWLLPGLSAWSLQELIPPGTG